MSKTLPDGTRLITGYVPKMYLTIIGLAVFAVVSVAFWIRFFRHGKQKYMLALTIGTTCMAIGFGCRIPMTDQPGSLGIFIAQTMFILLSPCAFLAHDYIILPRLATFINAEDCLFLRSTRVVRIFVWCDVITFWMQAAGGGMTAGAESMRNIGEKITIVGLILQLVSFGLYICLLVIFGYRVRSRYPQKWSSIVVMNQDAGGRSTIKLGLFEDWRTVYYALLWTTIGIMVRCVFRTIEYIQGYDGVLRTTESYFYLLDALPLLLAIAVWIFVWPPVFMREENQHFGKSSNLPMLPMVSPTSIRSDSEFISKPYGGYQTR